MKNKKVIRALCIVLFLVMAGGIVKTYAKNPEAEAFYSEFWDDPSRYDVWMMGSSHTYHAVYPMKIYENYGITSYDFCAPSGFIPEMYWMMMCALRESTPKMIVLDVFHVQQDYAITKDETKVKSALDCIPLSKTKIDAINDMLPEYTIGQKLRLMFPWIEYWNDFRHWNKYEFNPSLGCRFKVKVTDISDLKVADRNSKTDTDAMGFDYLNRIIDECEKRDIKLVFTAWPCLERAEGQEGMNAVRDIAEEHNIPFLEAAYEEGLLDSTINYADHKNHLNISGASRTNRYLGEFLNNNYDFADSESVDKEYWDMAVARYREFVGNNIRTASDRRHLMMWATDDAYEVTYCQGKDVELPEISKKLFEHMSDLHVVDADAIKDMCGEEVSGNKSVFIIKDKVLNETVDVAVFDGGVRIDLEK